MRYCGSKDRPGHGGETQALNKRSERAAKCATNVPKVESGAMPPSGFSRIPGLIPRLEQNWVSSAKIRRIHPSSTMFEQFSTSNLTSMWTALSKFWPICGTLPAQHDRGTSFVVPSSSLTCTSFSTLWFRRTPRMIWGLLSAFRPFGDRGGLPRIAIQGDVANIRPHTGGV